MRADGRKSIARSRLQSWIAGSIAGPLAIGGLELRLPVPNAGCWAQNPPVDHPEPSPRHFHLTWAECRTPLRRAATTLWLPAAAAFVASPLTECGHCVRTYLALLPVFPGLAAGLWLGATPLGYALAGMASVVLLTVVALGIGLTGRRWPFVAVPFAALATAQAIGLGNLLRM